MKLTESFDKRYLAKVGITVVSAAVALGIIIYAAYHLLDRLTPGLDLVDAVPKTVTHTVTADAYIMRDEEPLYTSKTASGSIAPAVRNGERVSIHGKIADIYANMSPEIEQRLSEIDEQIALLIKNRADNRSVQSASGLDSEIYEEVFTIREKCADGDYADALALKTNLLVSIRKKEILTGAVTDYQTQINKLESEKAALRMELGACLEQIYSSSAGYYFSEYDGYGNVFSSDLVDTMTYDDFVSMTESDPEGGYGMSIGTMVHDYRWYIACPMSKKDAAQFSDMTRCNVLFTYSGETLSMRPYRVIAKTHEDAAVVVFSCDKMPENFDYLRKQPVRITAAEYIGYEIPLEAVRVIDGYEGVYILDEVTIEFRRINPIYTTDSYVLCTGYSEELNGSLEDSPHAWISQNDIIIVSGRELYTGKVVG